MGTHPIKYFLLNKQELTYEVLIRGEEPAPNVLGLRKQITKLTSLIPNDDVFESGIDPAADCDGVLSSLTELSSRVNALNTKYDYNSAERAKALHNHIYHRLRRMDDSDPIFLQKISSLSSDFKMISKKLSTLQSSIPAQGTTSEPVGAQALQSSTLLESSQSIVSVQCEHTQTKDLSKLSYDGNGCVRAFVQRMNEYRTVRNLSSNKLLMYASEIFKDNALHWYRSVRDSINTWEELVEQLVRDFSPFDYDYRLMSEIRNRTQGERETIVIYLAIMSELFSRLSAPISEQEKLNILMHNIRPCYAVVLASCMTDINSIATLRKLCLSYEKVQCFSSRFHEPPKSSTRTLAPDLAYNEPKTNNNNNSYYNKSNNNNQSNFQNFKSHNSGVPVAAVDSKLPTSSNRPVFCPRCRTNEHSLRQCKEDRFPVCFKCGLKDFIFPNCPKCHPTDTKN